MAQEEQQVELYDFLYKDSNRFNSYYAQLFQGKLASLEEADHEKDSTEKNLEGNLQVVKGGAKHTSEIQTSAKRIIDPHDVITTDVINNFFDNQYIHTNFTTAPNGALVMAKGTLSFVDKIMLNTLASAYTMSVKANPDLLENPEAILGIQILQQMIAEDFLPSFYFLQTQDGHNIFGTVKDAGMEEPVTSYYFRHGNQGLGEVYVIGFKEVSADIDHNSFAIALGDMQSFNSVLNQMFLPQKGIKVTPIALFRKFEPNMKSKIVFGSASRKNRE